MRDQQWTSVRFIPGSATALVGRNFVALVASPLTNPLVDTWKEIIDEESASAIALLFASLRACPPDELPGLALVVWDGDEMRTVVRGEVHAEIYLEPEDDDAGVRAIAGQNLITWVECVTPVARQVRLAVSGSEAVDFDGTLYTASLGVLPAVGVELLRPLGPAAAVKGPVQSGATLAVGSEDVAEERSADPRGVEADPGEEVVAAEDEAGPGELGEPMPTAAEPVHDDASESDARLDGPDDDDEPELHEGDPRLTLSEIPPAPLANDSVDPLGGPLLTIGQPPPGGGHDPGASGQTGNYDDLFGSTMIRSVEEAAIRVGADDQPDDEDGAAHDRPDDDPAHDGMTIAASDLRKLRGGSVEGDDPSAGVAGLVGPSVLAITCTVGHANAPHAMSCRVCGVPLDQQSPVRMPRPVIGKFVFESGEEVAVDRTILIGRSPKVTGLVPDGHPPELVAVESPNKDVSRTHLEVRIEGWSVLAVDLNSANGTIVSSPGRPAQRLRPGEPFILGIGSTIRLADEVEFSMVAP